MINRLSLIESTRSHQGYSFYFSTTCSIRLQRAIYFNSGSITFSSTSSSTYWCNTLLQTISETIPCPHLHVGRGEERRSGVVPNVCWLLQVNYCEGAVGAIGA